MVRCLGASRDLDSGLPTDCTLLRLPPRRRSLPHLQRNIEGEASVPQSSPQFTASGPANSAHGQRRRRTDRIYGCHRERGRNLSLTSRTQCIFIRRYHLLRLECGLTPRSRRGPTALHQAHEAPRHIIRLAGLAQCRRSRLTSNVRRRLAPPFALSLSMQQRASQAARLVCHRRCSRTAAGQPSPGTARWSVRRLTACAPVGVHSLSSRPITAVQPRALGSLMLALASGAPAVRWRRAFAHRAA